MHELCPKDPQSIEDYKSLSGTPTPELNLRLNIVEMALRKLDEESIEKGMTEEETAKWAKEPKRQAAVLRAKIRERVEAGEKIEPIVIRANRPAELGGIPLSSSKN